MGHVEHDGYMGQPLVLYGSYIGHTYSLYTCAHYVTDLIIYLAAHWLELVHDSFVASETLSHRRRNRDATRLDSLVVSGGVKGA